MSNHLSPGDIKDVDDKRRSTLSTISDDQTTEAPTPNQPSIYDDKDVKVDKSSDVEVHSDSVSQQQNEDEAEKQGESLERVESSMYPGPLKLLFILISVSLAVFLVR